MRSQTFPAAQHISAKAVRQRGSPPAIGESMNPGDASTGAGLAEQRHLRTLVVDDSAMIRELLALWVKREARFELVGTAADGWQALERAGALQPDLILMDVDMPHLDGITATRLLKQSHPAPVIVIVTSDASALCRAEAQEAGADAFVAKSNQLRAELTAVLDELFPGNGEGPQTTVS